MTMGTFSPYSGVTRLSVVETAKLVRKALKLAFPTTKFSVRSEKYAGGASIHVNWIDGPSQSMVDKVAGVYAGADFDGMIDLKTHNDHWLEPDGSATMAKREGTTGSFVGAVYDPPTANSVLVSFGADYMICQRRLSSEVEAKVKYEIADYLGVDDFASLPTNVPVRSFKIEDGATGLSLDEHGNGEWRDSLVWQLGGARDYSKPCEHPPTARYHAGHGGVKCGACGA